MRDLLCASVDRPRSPPGGHLYYGGFLNSVFGGYGSGKTWHVLAVAAEFVRAR
ncbi:hypothetical protein [Halostreptopolyspora alba]|uniref:hypothetical protein n=1 Tax=Halostreptopolyspora alba TaxID=2487137 RepID=UPI0026A699EA